jgi:hypothetical protein
MTAGGGFKNAPGDHAWFDVTNDGPQQNFMFAQLTTGQTGAFSGKMMVRTDGGFAALPFSFTLPGTTSDLGLLASEQTFQMDYSIPAPPPVVPVALTPPPFQGPQPPVVPDPPVQTPPPVAVDPTIPPVADPHANPRQAPDQPQPSPNQPPTTPDPPQAMPEPWENNPDLARSGSTTPDQPQATPEPTLVTNPPPIFVVDPIDMHPIDGSFVTDPIFLQGAPIEWGNLRIVDFNPTTFVAYDGPNGPVNDAVLFNSLPGITNQFSSSSPALAALLRSFAASQGATEFSTHAAVPEPAALTLLLAVKCRLLAPREENALASASPHPAPTSPPPTDYSLRTTGHSLARLAHFSPRKADKNLLYCPSVN